MSIAHTCRVPLYILRPYGDGIFCYLPSLSYYLSNHNLCNLPPAIIYKSLPVPEPIRFQTYRHQPIGSCVSPSLFSPMDFLSVQTNVALGVYLRHTNQKQETKTTWETATCDETSAEHGNFFSLFVSESEIYFDVFS